MRLATLFHFNIHSKRQKLPQTGGLRGDPGPGESIIRITYEKHVTLVYVRTRNATEGTMAKEEMKG